MAKPNQQEDADLSKTPAPGTPATAGTKKSAEAKTEPDAQPTSAIELLKADHRKVESLFAEFETAQDPRKQEIIRTACTELTVHTLIEEEIFYPACRRAANEEEPLDEAQVEHDGAKLLIADLMRGRPDDRFRDAKFKVLAEQIKHHVGEEEKPGEGIFAKARAAGLDTPDLAQRLKSRKDELMARPDRLTPSRMVSIQDPAASNAYQSQENDMPRQGPDRDERGRFTSDDDDRGYRGRGESRSFDRDDDRGGRSYASSQYRNRDERGRFADDDDDRNSRDRGGRGRGQGGWFGDSEGHSRAAREGWDDRDRGGRAQDDDYRGGRGGYRSRDDDDDRGRGGGRGWYGDSEGHAQAAREGWDERGRGGGGNRSRDYDDDRGGRGRGQGGWFGDSEGHARAAREGWDDRNRGGSRSRSRDDDDDRGGRGRGGRGGWFGDPEGHSEASRRGWEDRR
ncbi:MAG TPA: hemerythrin domain-containing protein [Caulobacteraceae bacterium]|jgi:hemerythrin superfamily protein|nr:hemerythrin domain-containing protein [Caulobacteraceae bacterium]